MKSITKIVGITLMLALFACSKEQEPESLQAPGSTFQVEVLGKGLDCGDLFLVRFSEDDESRVNAYLEQNNAYYPDFYAVGLPDEFKEEGLIINITIGQCGTDDIPACSAMGPAYGIICIQTAETLSITASVFK